MIPDTPTKAILPVISDNGYAVTMTNTSTTAIDHETHERFIIRHDDDAYAAAELAQQVVIDLMDG